MMRALLFCLLLGGCGREGGPHFEFRADGPGIVRCGCAPATAPGTYVAHPEYGEETWAKQGVRIVVVDRPDAGPPVRQ